MRISHASISPGQGHSTGRQLLSQLYEAQYGRLMPQVLTTERGKPYFADETGYFSITHTKHHVFVALGDHPMGIDAEELTREMDLRLADKILSPSEKTQYDAAQDKRLALLTFWVLKEAQAKCTGEGLRGYPNHTRFSLDDPRVRTVHGCLLAVIEDELHENQENDHAV